MKRLGVNIDHVATLRNARGEKHPDPISAALYAIKHKLAKRVAIIDFDVHHGQGTEEIIEHINQPENLLFVSSHLFQKTKGYEFYPGTGKEMGKLEENIINVPLAPLWTKGSNTPTSSGG